MECHHLQYVDVPYSIEQDVYMILICSSGKQFVLEISILTLLCTLSSYPALYSFLQHCGEFCLISLNISTVETIFPQRQETRAQSLQ